MPEIVSGAEYATFINTFRCEPANQQEVVRINVDIVDQVASTFVGFVSATVHRSTDGTRVINYLQWESHDHLAAMQRSPEFQAIARRFAGLIEFDPHECEVVHVAERGRAPSRPSSARHTRLMPTLGHGKICHIELPAADPSESAAFYERVFGWKVRRDGPALVFDDPTEEVSGHWVSHRSPSEPGLLFYLWVEDVAAAVARVIAEGCELVQPIGGDPGEVTARFRDPGGNVVGLYQEPR